MSVRARARRVARSIALLITVLPAALAAQSGTIVGKVIDRASRLPIADARVVVPGTTLEALTSKDGDYRLNNVRAGRTTVGVFKLGHRAASDTVRLAAGQTLTVNFEFGVPSNCSGFAVPVTLSGPAAVDEIALLGDAIRQD